MCGFERCLGDAIRHGVDAAAIIIIIIVIAIIIFIIIIIIVLLWWSCSGPKVKWLYVEIIESIKYVDSMRLRKTSLIILARQHAFTVRFNWR